MATLKIVDSGDKLSVKVDGTHIPYAYSYTLSRTPNGTVDLKLFLSLYQPEIEIQTDKIEAEAVMAPKKRHP